MKRSYVLCAGLTALAMIFGQMASAQTTWYVATNGTGDGSSWLNAIDNIQGAISKATTEDDTVLVSNGVYETGGVTNWPNGTALTNRVAITNVITVRSANNEPTNTIIKGAKDNGTNGPSSVRCVHMVTNSSLIGFTLTNGATLLINQPTSGTNDNHYGGGVCSPSTNTIISNCVIAGNIAANSGGGAYYGTLRNCTLSTNQVLAISGQQGWGGGACKSILFNCLLNKNIGRTPGTCYGGAAQGCTLYDCTLSGGYASYGGGAYNSTMYNCAIISNSVAGGNGAGVRIGYLYNCLLMGNSGAGSGGGAYQTRLYNCTVVGNSASYGGGFCGASLGDMNNCIVYFNTASTEGSNWYAIKTFTNSCTAPAATNGVGNITADPMFVDMNAANYRLSAVSPCIDTGINDSWTTDPADVRSKDLDVKARRRYGGVDMGAYEHIHAGTICVVR
ncbi:MAG: hypothetical protein Q7J98_07895 [Kiritimatiellia bacterium]|nr:hypothetical protein [Kiritimatiellia bacterium]